MSRYAFIICFGVIFMVLFGIIDRRRMRGTSGFDGISSDISEAMKETFEVIFEIMKYIFVTLLYVFRSIFNIIWMLLKHLFAPIIFLWKAMKAIHDPFKKTKTAFILVFILVCSFFGLAFLKYVLVDRPQFADRIYKYNPYSSLVVMDRNGKLLGVFGDKKKIYKSIKDIPETIQYAFISAEDRRFDEHFGIDSIGVIGSIVHNVKKIFVGGRFSGNSTITQQVARNYLLQTTHYKSKILRKITEIFAAIELEHRFEKKEILEIYLNEIYLGMGSYGVAAAAQCYFNKTLDDLTIDEMALIGGLASLPGRNPHNKNVDSEKVTARRNHVITRMEQDGYISASEAKMARNANINNVKFNPLNQDENAALGGYVMGELRRLGYTEDQIKSKGLKVYLTIDSDAQRAAMTALKGVQQVQKREDSDPQAALVAIDSETGDIIAMIGGLGYYDYFGVYRKNELNRTVSFRQPAATMMPLVYAAALESGAISPDDTFDASPLVIEGRTISDQCDRQLGIADAIAQCITDVMAQSSDRAVIRVQQRTGGKYVIHLARQMDVETPMQDNSSLPFDTSASETGMRRKPPIIFKTDDEQEKWCDISDHYHCASPLNLADAIAQSSNRAAIRVYQRTTDRNFVFNLMWQMGLETPMEDSPLLPLGGVTETRLLDMTNAYVPFFSQGVMRKKPRLISKVCDEQGNEHEHESDRATQVMSGSTAELVRSALRATVEKGTGRAAGSIPDAAGKTGDNRDALFIGAAPSRFGTTVVGVWVGFDDYRSLEPGDTESGDRTGVPVWAQFFQNIQR